MSASSCPISRPARSRPSSNSCTLTSRARSSSAGRPPSRSRPTRMPAFSTSTSTTGMASSIGTERRSSRASRSTESLSPTTADALSDGRVGDAEVGDLHEGPEGRRGGLGARHDYGRILQAGPGGECRRSDPERQLLRARRRIPADDHGARARARGRRQHRPERLVDRFGGGGRRSASVASTVGAASSWFLARRRSFAGTRLLGPPQKQHHAEYRDDPDHQIAHGRDVENVDQLESAPADEEKRRDKRDLILAGVSPDEHHGGDGIRDAEYKDHGHADPEQIDEEYVRQGELPDDRKKGCRHQESAVRPRDQKRAADKTRQAVQHADSGQPCTGESGSSDLSVG